MAITNLVQAPEQFTPSANGAVFLFNSGYSHLKSFAYIVDVSVNQQWSHRDRIAPDAGSGLLYWNANSISSFLTSDPVSASTLSAITPAINTVQRFDLYVGVSYSFMSYSALTSGGGSITFQLDAIHPFIVGDELYFSPNATDPLNQYSGKRLVTGVPNNTSITIAGSLSTTPVDQTGRIRRADGQPAIITGITPSSIHYQFKSAIPRAEYFDYDQDTIRVGNTNAKLGTNMPRSGYRMRANGRLWIFNCISANDLFMTITTYGDNGIILGVYQFLNPYPVSTTKAVYARCGPQDVTDAEASAIILSGPTSIINDDVASYRIQWRGGSPFFQAKSDTITINLDRSPAVPECPVQLLFRCQRGSYVTALCTPAKRITGKTKKQTYKRRGFDLSATAPEYVSDQTIPEYVTYAVDHEESFATSAVLPTKDDAAFFSELFRSTEVYEVQEDGSLIPVIVYDGTREAVNPYLIRGPIRWPVEYSRAYDQPLNI